MSKDIWRDCKKQPPLVDDGELVLMDSNGKVWVGFCEITSDGISYFANNAEPLKNDFVKYARIEKLLALETELERTRKALEIALCSLQDIAESNGDFITGASTPLDEHEYADMMLKEIKRQMKIKTALEQKDK